MVVDHQKEEEYNKEINKNEDIKKEEILNGKI